MDKLVAEEDITEEGICQVLLDGVTGEYEMEVHMLQRPIQGLTREGEGIDGNIINQYERTMCEIFPTCARALLVAHGRTTGR